MVAGAPSHVLATVGRQTWRHDRSRSLSLWLACWSSLVLLALGLALYVDNRTVPDTGQFLDPVLPFMALVFPPIGAFIVSRVPGNPVGWLLCATSSAAVAFFAQQYAVYALVTEPGAVPGGAWAAWLGAWTWVPAFLAVWMVLPLLLRLGSRPSRSAVVLSSTVAALVGVIAVMAALAPELPGSPALRNPIGWTPMPQVAGTAETICVLILAPLGVAALIARCLASSDDERGRLMGLTMATTAMVAVPLAGSVAALAGWPVPLGAYQGAGVAALAALAAALTRAVLRHHLYRIDIELSTVVNGVLAYVALAVAGVLAYAAVAALLVHLIPGPPGLAPPLVAAVVAAGLAYRLRLPLRRGVDRLLYRQRAYDYDTLVALGQCLQSNVSSDALLPAMVETIASALKVPGVAVSVGRAGDGAAHAAWGETGPDAIDLPMVHQGEDVGCLTVSPRAPAHSFDAADRRLLEYLANQAGAAAYALCLSADLRRSRERLVSTREEERRRLRRELHDGIKPALAGVTLGLDAVVNLVGPDRAEATDLLVRLKDELRAAGSDLRSLAHDLRPPALDELGLVGALQQHANALNRSGGRPTVVVEAPEDTGPLPAAVEVAAYRIGQEALENARSHASARRCEVLVTLSDGQLQLEVNDDGRGLEPGRAVGVGLLAMRERAAELGGTCSVEPRPEGGTRVRARLPLPGP